MIRSLGRAGVPVYGVHEGPWAPAANSRYLAGRFFWQPSPADVDRVLTGLLRLAEHIGQPSVLLTTDDAGAVFLAEHGHDLRRSFLFPDPPRDLPRRLAGKYSLYEVCREFGVCTPRALMPGSLTQAREFALAAGYPLIAKLATPWAKGSGLPQYLGPGQPGRPGSRLRGLRAIRRRADAPGVHPGHVGARLVLPRLLRRQLDVPAAFTGVKERSYPGRRRADQPRALGANERLRGRDHYASSPGWATADFWIWISASTSATAHYNLLDFNPRLGAQFRVFRDTAGTDVALAAYLDLTGQPIPPGEQVDGRRFLVENYDPISALAQLRSGELRPLAWLASLRTVDETAWFARDDLRPFGLMCLRMGWRLASRPFATTTRRRFPDPYPLPGWPRGARSGPG